jgi:putative ATP-binding cassette transporter
MLNGQDINKKNREWYRQHFSTVFSDYYVFKRLLGENNNSITSDGNDYLTKLLLSKKVNISGGQFSTTDLSQGQKKRLALVSAYLENRPIYLFDEWAADQDPMFKNIFYTELLPELKQEGKLVIVISHDDHYYHVADKIIKMYEGRVELISNK